MAGHRDDGTFAEDKAHHPNRRVAKNDVIAMDDGLGALFRARASVHHDLTGALPLYLHEQQQLVPSKEVLHEDVVDILHRNREMREVLVEKKKQAILDKFKHINNATLDDDDF